MQDCAQNYVLQYVYKWSLVEIEVRSNQNVAMNQKIFFKVFALSEDSTKSTDLDTIQVLQQNIHVYFKVVLWSDKIKGEIDLFSI